MRFVLTTALLAFSSMGHAPAQGTFTHVPVSAVCAELNQTVVTQVANGHIAEAEIALSASVVDRNQDGCAGLILHNTAKIMSASGRFAEAERLAEQSVTALEKIYPPNDLVLLRPLQILVAVRFEQGKTAKAREAFKRMQSIRIERPEDGALVHGMAAALLQGAGRLSEAEPEYLAAFAAWKDAGRGETANAGSVLNNLASLYVNEQRLDEAGRVLDQALAIFSRATDAVPMDRIKLLALRAVLRARQGEWRKAEEDLHDALSMADREPPGDPVVLRSLLTNYAHVLRRNHHGRVARGIEARAATLPAGRAAVVDVIELRSMTTGRKE